MSQSTDKEEGSATSDDSSSFSEEGWGLLLGGLSTDLMASTHWESEENENPTKTDHSENRGDAIRLSPPNEKFGGTLHKVQSAVGDQSKKIVCDNLEMMDGIQTQSQQQPQQQMVFQRAFCVSPNGQILKPPVRVLDRSSQKKGNVLIATKYIPKGSVIFTERSLEGIQVPSSSPGKGDLYAVRGCQNCFKSLEPASCLSSNELPFSELWPVKEYDSDPLFESTHSSIVIDSVEHSSMVLHDKSGRVTCRKCVAIFCNRYCAKKHLETIGDCCRCMRAIEGLVDVVVSSQKELFFSINDQDEGDCASSVDIDPVLVLAARMFIAQVQKYRSVDGSTKSPDSSSIDFLYYGLCGKAEDIRALGFGPPLRLGKDIDKAGKTQLPLYCEYEAVANAIELTESERTSDRYSLKQFHRIVAIAQRNSISLTTGSPFRTYYQAMIRKTGGRGSSLQQEVVTDVARLLGSADGKWFFHDLLDFCLC